MKNATLDTLDAVLYLVILPGIFLALCHLAHVSPVAVITHAVDTVARLIH